MKDIINGHSFRLPLMQAPFVYYLDQVDWIASIANQGLLASYSCDGLTLSQIEKDIKLIQTKTSQPFAVWLSKNDYTKEDHLTEMDARLLDSAYSVLAMSGNERYQSEHFDNIVMSIAALSPSMIVFKGGLASEKMILELKKRDITVVAVASTVLEAIACEHRDVDVIILQGIESAGPISSFKNNLKDKLLPITSLLFYAKSYTTKSLLVWGGYNDVKSIASALLLGASGVILDTPIWSTKQSPMPARYRDALEQSNEMNCIRTYLFSSVGAQLLDNNLTYLLRHISKTEQGVDISQERLYPIIQKAIKMELVDYMPLWAGTYNITNDIPVHVLTDSYERGLSELVNI